MRSNKQNVRINPDLHLVIGSSGMIGSNLLAHLSTLPNAEVWTLDRLNSQSQSSLVARSIMVDVVQDHDKALAWIESGSKSFNEANIWHLAANSDIRRGNDCSLLDYFDTLGTTFFALEASQLLGASFIGFTSSSAVYGDRGHEILFESDLALNPISNYGQMKLWSENLIEQYSCGSTLARSLVFRLPNVLGLPMTHGVVKDLSDQLATKPMQIQVLGNGKQKKQFVHIREVINAMAYLKSCCTSKFEIFNIAPSDEGLEVKEIAESLVERMSVTTKIKYGNSAQGWKGDIPIYRMSDAKLKSTGFLIQKSSREAIQQIIEDMELRTAT